MTNANMEDFRKEQKKREIKEKINQKYQQGKDWVTRNKEAVIAATPVVIGCITTVSKVVGRHINIRKQEVVKTHYIFDRSLGMYWKLNRELRTSEQLEVERRKKNGERMGDILSDMGVLRR